MTDADLLAYPGLSAYERRIVELRVRDGLRANAIAHRLGLRMSQVHGAIGSAKARAAGRLPPACVTRTNNGKPLTMDAGWFDRQVAYVRSIADDPDDPTHVRRYLNGIAIVWGDDWAERVESEASR